MSEGAGRMSAMELRGRETASKIDAGIRQILEGSRGRKPKLAVFRVGSRQDDIRYEKGILRRFDSLGLDVQVFHYPEDIASGLFIKELEKANEDRDIHGILVFRPLPTHIDDKFVAQTIDPLKDVDGISPANVAKVFSGDQSGFAPCTAVSVMAMLDTAQVDLSGLRTVVVGRSMVIGKPLSMLLLGRDATVTVCHSRTKDLATVCKEADLLIACVGRARMIDAAYIRPGAVVIDVGINVDDSGSVCGDVDYEAVGRIAGAISPSPGGVGVVTTSVLASQVVKAAANVWCSN